MSRSPLHRFWYDNSLSLVFLALFLLALLGQAVSGTATYDAGQLAAGLEPVGFWRYVTSSSFAVDVVENWQSEYLQFLLYITATVWLLQRGSSESKEPGKAGRESDEDQRVGQYATPESPTWATAGGWRTVLYSRSLGLAMGGIFLLCWLAQSVTGRAAWNEERLGELRSPLTWPEYLTAADFWNRTLQNWQSEFLAVGSMAIFAVFLRHRGSPESKPVGASHTSTGSEG